MNKGDRSMNALHEDSATTTDNIKSQMLWDIDVDPHT